MNAKHRRLSSFDEDLEHKYEILDVVGGGGMGRVLRARHRQLKRLVAIKLLQRDIHAPDAVRRFLREARAIAQIRSPHVAHVMDAGILQHGQPYIVMEYLEGQDLARMLGMHGRLPIVQAIGFTLQALEALAAAHSLKIIHRDIKPGNLFATRGLDGETTIKVVDFGLAKTGHAFDTLDHGVTERGAVLGTPRYMSPEQFVDAQDVDARADIWGIGATLFELLTATPPFAGKTLPQIYTAVMHRPVSGVRAAAPDVDEGLERVIARCLARERDARFTNVAELAEALAPFAGDARGERAARIRRIFESSAASVDSMEPLELETDAASGSGEVVPRSARVARSILHRHRPAEPALPMPPASKLHRRTAIVGVGLLLAAASGTLLVLASGDGDLPVSPRSTPAGSAAPARTSLDTSPRVGSPSAPDSTTPHTLEHVVSHPQPVAEPAVETPSGTTAVAPKPKAGARPKPNARKARAATPQSSRSPVPPDVYQQYP